MNIIIRNIPNALTILNLLCGIIGIIFWQHNIFLSATCVFIAMFFDFFDGLSAKLLNATSAFGKELDSLADIVSFGVLPSLILFDIMYPDFTWLNIDEIRTVSYLVFMIPIFSALRLAKFNIDTKQTSVFFGFPTPANAFLIASIPFVIKNAQIDSIIHFLFTNSTFIVILAIICSILLVLPIPLLSFKIKSLSLRENIFIYVFLVYIITAFAIFGWLGSVLTILGYFFISIVYRIHKASK